MIRRLLRNALYASLWLLCGTEPGEAQPGRPDPDFDRVRYSSARYDNFREITYWAYARVFVRDYRYGSDAESLGLAGKDEIGALSGAPEIREHFLREFRRLFGDLPFHDQTIGYPERFNKFLRDNKSDATSFSERWDAAELARRRSLYPGRGGALECEINVKRRAFPILYIISCSISADDDLHVFHVGRDEVGSDIGFSTPEHISGEIRRAITEMLKENADRLAKIRKYGKRATP